MGATIRPALPSDCPGVVETVRSVYEEHGFTWEEGGYHADLYDLDLHYIRKGHFFWVAEEAGAIVGTVALELFPPVPGPENTLVIHDGSERIAACDSALQRLYVRPEHRRSGIGTDLFVTTIEAARSWGRRAMEIWSDKRFDKAHRLYEKYGAELIGDRICHDPDLSPEWGLFLRL